MISVYKNQNKEKKQYKVKYVKKGTTKNGNPYTMFKINDNKMNQQTKQWNYQSYTVFVWDNLEIKDNDLIEFLEIESLECEEKEWNGTKRIERTIFAKVRVIPVNNGIQEEMTELTETETDDFPF